MNFIATLLDTEGEPTFFEFHLSNFGERKVWTLALEKALDEAEKSGLDLDGLETQFE